ncbi:MAG: hypothetical protein GMKNLPBB_00083 [Myxococcota bacterium]|nr:hypothetical protein [Myxococcota bacterium]
MAVLTQGMAYAQAKPVGVVKKLKGAASAQRVGSEVPVVLVQGAAVMEGDTVMSGADSIVVMTFADDSRIALGAKTRFKVLTVTKSGNTRTGSFDLMGGKLRAMVSKGFSSDSKFEIKAGTAVAGIRGTELDLENEDGKVKLVVYSGEVGFALEGQSPVSIYGNMLAGASGGSVETKKMDSSEANNSHGNFSGGENVDVAAPDLNLSGKESNAIQSGDASAFAKTAEPTVGDGGSTVTKAKGGKAVGGDAPADTSGGDGITDTGGSSSKQTQAGDETLGDNAQGGPGGATPDNNPFGVGSNNNANNTNVDSSGAGSQGQQTAGGGSNVANTGAGNNSTTQQNNNANNNTNTGVNNPNIVGTERGKTFSQDGATGTGGTGGAGGNTGGAGG